MKDFRQAILDLIRTTLNQGNGKRQIVYLEGGYYDTRFGPQEFSVNTLAGCIDVAEEVIKRQYKVTRIILGVLANNIGIICGENVCKMPSNDIVVKKDSDDLILPELLKQMIDKSKVAKNDQVIFTNEKTLRNRGLRIVKEIADKEDKYSITMDKNDKKVLCNILIDGNKIPLAIKKGSVWSARCPLIMGQHYSDLYIKIAKKYGNSANQLLVDMSEMYDRHKVNNGAKVAMILLQKMYGYSVGNLKIANFCFQDDELTQYECDLAEGEM